MKKIAAILSLVSIASTLFTSVAFSEEIVKTCSFKVSIPGESRVIPTTYQIIKTDAGLIAKATQTIKGAQHQLRDESVTLSEHTVRADLSTNIPKLNEAEQLIKGIQEVLSNPEFQGLFSVGLDLKLIRSAKFYQIGQFTHMGGMVIIEAKDESGKILGSFVTGFMPFACE